MRSNQRAALKEGILILLLIAATYLLTDSESVAWVLFIAGAIRVSAIKVTSIGRISLKLEECICRKMRAKDMAFGTPTI